MSSCFWFGRGHPRWYRGRFFSRVRLQYLCDQIADQIADGRAAERSFDDEVRDHVLCERQFGRSFLSPILHLNGEARRARLIRPLLNLMRRHKVFRLRLRISLRSPLDQVHVAAMPRAWRGDLLKTRFISPQRNDSVVKGGSPQTDAQPGAGHLQRTDSRADQLGNFLSPRAALHQIFDLLDLLWRKPCLPPPTLGSGCPTRRSKSSLYPLQSSRTPSRDGGRSVRIVAVVSPWSRYAS